MNLTADKFISLREERTLFKAIAKASDRAAIVDAMLFQLLSLTGLRISEALSLKWADIFDSYLVVRKQKNGKDNGTVLIGNRLKALLEAFKASNPYSHSEYLFNTQKGRYSRTNAHDRLKYWLKVADLRDTISCHCFRHTYATRSLDAGLSISFVKSQLRHSNIAVTSVYLHYSQESVDKFKEAF